MPALPLHEAGKYVVAAYLVVLALVIIYVAIMATRLRGIEREVGELNELLDRRELDEPVSLADEEHELASSGSGTDRA